MAVTKKKKAGSSNKKTKKQSTAKKKKTSATAKKPKAAKTRSKAKSKSKSKPAKKKKAFGGYAISFAGRKETAEQVFGKKPITPSEMTKKIWAFVKSNNLSNK